MNQNLDKYYTELDKELQQLAATDWPTFCNLIGLDSIANAKVCLLKSRGKSLNQISVKTRKTVDAVRWTIKNKCDCAE